jgi:LytS/YehU family sensor histidine kinase
MHGDMPPFGGGKPPEDPPGMEKNRWLPIVIFILRDVILLTLVVVLSTAIKMSSRWTKIEAMQKEMQQAMIEAELKNLKNQINPHFLLNTLNNIYALAQLNSPKVKPAIMDLSRLLQYVLYENNKMYVPLKEEVNFIGNYIDLMRLRLPANTNLSVKFDIRENSGVMIAPLIFISLIENAFKHGVSSDEYSFIDISLTEKEDGKIEFLCRNSHFPKDESDKSGSGIGLQQVKKRLELIYPYRYMWHKEIENNIYSTVLIIET